jgi:hypothetical protein
MSELGPALPPPDAPLPGAPAVNTAPLMVKIGLITAALLTLTTALSGLIDEYRSMPLSEQSVEKAMTKAQEPPTFSAPKGHCYYKVPNLRTDFKVSFQPRKRNFITGRFIDLLDFSAQEPEKFNAGSVPSYETATCKALKNPLSMEQVKAAKAEARQKIHKNILTSNLYKENAGREGIISVLADLEAK